jgi:hypothetical protein
MDTSPPRRLGAATLSSGTAPLAGQYRLYDLIQANEWINAYAAGNTQLANIYLARMRPEFRTVFEAWLALDPFHHSSAPPGPLFMPQYKLALDAQATLYHVFTYPVT